MDDMKLEGCGDNSCKFREHDGIPRQGTNGGCRCISTLMSMEEVIRLKRNFYIMQQRINEMPEWIYTKDKTPNFKDGTPCWCCRIYSASGENEVMHPEVLHWNDHYGSWDDSQADDHACDIDDVVCYMELPTKPQSTKETRNDT